MIKTGRYTLCVTIPVGIYPLPKDHPEYDSGKLGVFDGTLCIFCIEPDTASLKITAKAIGEHFGLPDEADDIFLQER